MNEKRAHGRESEATSWKSQIKDGRGISGEEKQKELGLGARPIFRFLVQSRDCDLSKQLKIIIIIIFLLFISWYTYGCKSFIVMLFSWIFTFQMKNVNSDRCHSVSLSVCPSDCRGKISSQIMSAVIGFVTDISAMIKSSGGFMYGNIYIFSISVESNEDLAH